MTLCLPTKCTHRLIQAMRRPTGFTMDNSYVALDHVDVWCPDVVVMVRVCACVGVLLLGGGGGGGQGSV